MSFESFRLHPDLASALKTLAFTVPTPIQNQAIPKALEGRDLLGLAQTGTGKTAAFALPILQRLLQGPRGRVRALILAPTRELAEQIHEAFGQFGQRTSLRSATVYGGVGMAPQIKALRGGAEIIAACPGRLLDHIEQGHADLSSLEVLVLDEADQMFDMGFLPSIRKILKRLPSRRQTLLFSATMPDDIRGLAHECLRDPVTIQVNHTQPLTTVSHALYPVKEHLKTTLLLELVRPTHMETVLIFTRTKHRAKRLGLKLKAAGFEAASLQGNLSQNQRKAALDGFRAGRFNILVATDIAARGIDVSEISHVINFDIPNTPEAYTHRIGRTGRAANTGDAFTLVTEADKDMVKTIERRLGRPIERRRLENFDYDQAAPPQPQPAHRHPPHRPAAHPPRHGHAAPHPPQVHRPGGSPAGARRHRGRRRPY
ncbi:MAG: DEAD/DEAH box helicase [Elusimicrobiota bacterium]|jgi:ATP-dependent RNA helicase RhlE